DHARVLARLREARVLGEEPVSRVDRLRARAHGHVEDLLDRQVVLARGPLAEVVRLRRALYVRRVAVELGVHRHTHDLELLERAHDADRDLAAVCDQHLLEHRAPRIDNGSTCDAHAMDREATLLTPRLSMRRWRA